MVKRFGMSEKQIVSLTRIVGEYERRRDEIEELKRAVVQMKRKDMVYQLERADELNEGSFLN